MNFELISHKAEVIEALEEANEKALEMIGTKCSDYAALLAPVDTGRLKNSITWATRKNEGHTHSYTDDDGNGYSYQVGIGCEDDTVYVGTNVEYAIYQEMGPSAENKVKFKFHPYLKPAVLNHLDEYKRIAEKVFEKAF